MSSDVVDMKKLGVEYYRGAWFASIRNTCIRLGPFATRQEALVTAMQFLQEKLGEGGI